MIAPEHAERVLSGLPFLRRAGPEVRRELLRHASLARVPAGRDVFVAGDEAEAIALLAGVFDFCIFAPLFGAPLSGPKIRAGK